MKQLMTSTKESETLVHKKILLILVSIFMLLSVLIGDTATREVFPFFNWKLFYYIPKTKRDYGVLIRKIDGEAIKPIYYEALSPKFKNTSVMFYTEHFLEAGRDFKKGKDPRKRVEILFNPKHSFSVSLMERRANGLKRLEAKDKFSPTTFISNTRLEDYEIN